MATSSFVCEILHSALHFYALRLALFVLQAAGVRPGHHKWWNLVTSRSCWIKIPQISDLWPFWLGLPGIKYQVEKYGNRDTYQI